MMSVHAWGEIVFIIKAAVSGSTASAAATSAARAAKSFSGYFVKISCQRQIKVVMEKVTLPVPQPLYLLIHCDRQSESQMYYFIHTNNQTKLKNYRKKTLEVRSDKMKRKRRKRGKRRKSRKRRMRRKRRKIMENHGTSWNIMDHHGIEN